MPTFPEHLTRPGQQSSQPDIRCHFIIDTTTYAPYAGEMAAYLTGQAPGEDQDAWGHSVAEALPDQDRAALAWAEGIVAFEQDEDGFLRTGVMVPTPGVVNNGRGETFPEDTPTGDFYLNRAWPAYQSVDVIFERALTQTEIAQLSERARQFTTFYTHARCDEIGACASNEEPISIIGFRVILEQRSYACTAVFPA